jgi:hypothetical protein
MNIGRITNDEPMRETLVLECCVCRKPFEFDARHQQFYAAHEFCLPRRCVTCRAARKHLRAEIDQTMATK